MDNEFNLRDFHLKDDYSSRALCGVKVNLRPEAAVATNLQEVTCIECLRVRASQAQESAQPAYA